MKTILAVLAALTIASAAKADIELTNVTKASSIKSTDEVLSVTNGTKARLVTLSTLGAGLTNVPGSAIVSPVSTAVAAGQSTNVVNGGSVTTGNITNSGNLVTTGTNTCTKLVVGGASSATTDGVNVTGSIRASGGGLFSSAVFSGNTVLDTTASSMLYNTALAYGYLGILSSTNKWYFGNCDSVTVSNHLFIGGSAWITNNLTVSGTIAGNSNVVIRASGSGETNRSVVTGACQFFSATNSASANLAEMYVQSEDGTETIISPHATDAPTNFYDSEGMKELVLRDENPFTTNGTVSWINLSRMAKMTELNTKAILYLAGDTSANFSNALVKLQDKTSGQRQCIMKEKFSEFNARTGANIQTRDWNAVEQARQDAYDALRIATSNQIALATATNAILQAQIDSLLLEPQSPERDAAIAVLQAQLLPVPEAIPERDIRRSKPTWMNRSEKKKDATTTIG